jgi:hypothetical protein
VSPAIGNRTLSDADLFDTPPTASRPGQQVVRATLDQTTSPVPVFPPRPSAPSPSPLGEGWGEGRIGICNHKGTKSTKEYATLNGFCLAW